MKVRYALTTDWPTNAANPEGFEALDWFQHGEIPFVPVAGMMIDCGDGDLRQVREVYWCASEPDSLEVFFEDETPRELAYWLRGGWQSDDLPKSKRPRPKKRGSN